MSIIYYYYYYYYYYLYYYNINQNNEEGSLPPVTNYVGTYERSQHNFLTEFVRDWVANATAQYRGIACEKNSNCTVYSFP